VVARLAGHAEAVARAAHLGPRPLRDRRQHLVGRSRQLLPEGQVEVVAGPLPRPDGEVAELEVTGTEAASVLLRRLEQQILARDVLREHAAVDAVGHRDQLATDERTAHPEERQDPAPGAALLADQVVRFVAEDLLDDPAPAAQVEERTVLVLAHEAVPARVLAREQLPDARRRAVRARADRVLFDDRFHASRLSGSPLQQLLDLVVAQLARLREDDDLADQPEADQLHTEGRENHPDDEDRLLRQPRLAAEFTHQRVDAERDSEQDRQHSEDAEEPERLLGEPRQEADREDVEDAPHVDADAVEAVAAALLAVTDLDLDDVEALPLRQHRQEAVHLPVDVDVLEDLVAHAADARVEVVEPDAHRDAQHPVEEARLQAVQPRIDAR